MGEDTVVRNQAVLVSGGEEPLWEGERGDQHSLVCSGG